MALLSEITDDAPSCTEYIDNMTPTYRGGFIRQRDHYKLNKVAVDQLRELVGDYQVVALFADWCGDSRRAIPVLSLLEQELDIKIRALGGMTRAPYGSDVNWAVPPSPIEVETCDIRSSPTVIVFKASGEEVGRIKTKPRNTRSIEEELVWLILNRKEDSDN
ncbi:MAG: thioredoxin family protein [Candidatus Thorarchaeota archaeon]